MKLYAISDLHITNKPNLEGLVALPAQHDDWLIVAGDIAENAEDVRLGLRLLTSKFARVFWTPGNHELWSTGVNERRGLSKYRQVIEIARKLGVATPEDPYTPWTQEGFTYLIAPLFLLYDYSFRPAKIAASRALEWADATKAVSRDESLVDPWPFSNIPQWCEQRLRLTEEKLREAARRHRLILVNHFPLKEELVRSPAGPAYSLWCGTRRTADWHKRFRALVVIFGHLHTRTTHWYDGVRFEGVSLGNPDQWDRQAGIAAHLRQILPYDPMGAK